MLVERPGCLGENVTAGASENSTTYLPLGSAGYLRLGCWVACSSGERKAICGDCRSVTRTGTLRLGFPPNDRL